MTVGIRAVEFGLREVAMRVLERIEKIRTLGQAIRRAQREESGQALAEMALVTPILLVLVFGIVEFGAAWRSYQVITNAAREGARRAVMAEGLVDTSEAAVLGIVEDVMTSGGLDYDPGQVTFSCNGGAGSLCGPGARGAAEEVAIDYPYEFVFIGPLLDLACVGCADGFGTITLSTSSVMRSEG